MPTARTSGSANGSSMSERSARVAIARAAAAMVAVAPTLDARSQVSPSDRVEVMPPNLSAGSDNPSRAACPGSGRQPAAPAVDLSDQGEHLDRSVSLSS
jgi:hypothetical protein